MRRGVMWVVLVALAAIGIVTRLPGVGARLGLVGGGAGTIEGFVRLAGTADALPTPVTNTTDPDVCGLTQSLEDLLVDPTARGVANAVAALIDVPDSLRRSSPTPRRHVIDNRGCRFHPHVGVAALGDTLVALNSDPVFHTTHYYGPLQANVALTQPGEAVPKVADQTGIITILCDLHGWMRGFVRVDDHRFHAVSDERGLFRIREVPPGAYTLEIWHEKLGTRRITVEVTAGRTSRIDMELSAPDAAAG